MKKLILAAIAVTCAVSVYAQGTIVFNNRTGSGTSHVWGPSASTPGLSFQGQAITGDSPVGTVNYAGAGMTLIGATLVQGQQTYAQLIGLNGADQPEASLTPQSQITTFRTGSGAGFLAVGTATLATIPKDAAVATLQLVAWDNSTGLYPTWSLAREAWESGFIVAGKSTPWNALAIGGDVNTPATYLMPSFNMYSLGVIPEPSSFALAGLGAAALMIFRRRK